MVKVLIANQNIEQNNLLCQYLSNSNDLDILQTTDGISTLKQYKEIKPDIFILDTNLDISYIDLIDQISFDRNEKLNCNTILISSIPNQSINIMNVAKLYKTFYFPFNTPQNIFDTVVEMSNNALDRRIDRLFLKLNISLRSNPSNRVRTTLTKCYYSPELLANLNELFDLVAKEFNTTGDGIRSSFRTALRSLNSSLDKELPNFAIYKLFEKGEEITPKSFLDVSTYYLRNTKK